MNLTDTQREVIEKMKGNDIFIFKNVFFDSIIFVGKYTKKGPVNTNKTFLSYKTFQSLLRKGAIAPVKILDSKFDFLLVPGFEFYQSTISF